MGWWEDKVEKPLSDAGSSIKKEVKSCFSGGCDPALMLNKAAKGAAINTAQGFAKPVKEEFNEAVDHLFDDKLNPFANKVDFRQGNNGQAPRGDISKYRLFYPWVSNADNVEYPGNVNWGNLDEGGWDTITLDHIANPFNTGKHGNNYWRLEGFTSNCSNRVFNVTLLIVDVIT